MPRHANARVGRLLRPSFGTAISYRDRISCLGYILGASGDRTAGRGMGKKGLLGARTTISMLGANSLKHRGFILRTQSTALHVARFRRFPTMDTGTCGSLMPVRRSFVGDEGQRPARRAWPRSPSTASPETAIYLRVCHPAYANARVQRTSPMMYRNLEIYLPERHS